MNYHPELRRDGPRYLSLADAIVEDIVAGRLAPGALLPASRPLAKQLGLHRNTVVRAYEELASQGWVTARVGRGTRVADALPRTPSGLGQPPELAGFPLPPLRFRPLGWRPDCRYSFQAGHPDLRLLPLDVLARAYRRSIRGRGRQLVDYGDPQGLQRLREALSTWLSTTRGLRMPSERILITRGSQQALFLAAHTAFSPGDHIAVEAYGYRPAWEALRSAGLTLVPIPVDANGLDVEALAKQPRIDGLYVTPHHQYPTGAMLSAPRRRQLLELARRRRFAILEDDYDHEFHWHGAPVAPLAARDDAGVVLYISTLSKAFAPGLRVAWVTGPKRVIERMTQLRRLVDRQGDQVVERAVAELIEDGELQRHIRRVRRVYRDRREALRRHLHEIPGMQVNDPPGGLGLWCDLPGVDVAELQRRCNGQDVDFSIASEFRFSGEESALRLGFPALDLDELAEGVRRFDAQLKALR